MSSSVPPQSVDVIIVGAGATGGWAAHCLAKLGFKVALLNAGSRVDGPALHKGQQGFLSLLHQFVKGADSPAAPVTSGAHAVQSQCSAYSAATREFFVNDIANPYVTAPGKPFVWIRSRLVGGRTNLWTPRVLVRMSDHQFKAASHDGFGPDWPICYRDLEPYYESAERMLGVYAANDGHEEVPDGAFLKPRELSAAELHFKHVVEARWPKRSVRMAPATSWAAPGASQIDPSVPWFSSAGSSIPSALATGNVQLIENAVVSRVLLDPTRSRAQGVQYRDAAGGAERQINAGAVLLCASTLESTRILLNSACEGHPAGLGNASDALGRYLTDHTFSVVLGHNDKGPGTLDPQFPMVYMPSFCAREGDRRHLRGYQVQGTIGFPYPTSSGGTANGCILIAIGEVLPRPENRVTLRRDVVDEHGIPCLEIDYAYSANERTLAHDACYDLEQMARAAGYDDLRRTPELTPGSSYHEVGTARMGADPATSVLNWKNQVWGIPNLLVTDGASFVTAGFQNPTLTMLALTGRACDLLAKDYAHLRSRVAV